MECYYNGDYDTVAGDKLEKSLMEIEKDGRRFLS